MTTKRSNYYFETRIINKQKKKKNERCFWKTETNSISSLF